MLVGLIVFAIATIETIKLRRAIVYMGVFSLLASFVYILYNAPDVAIAQAIIGSTLSVILLLVALKKHKIVTIYYVDYIEQKDRVHQYQQRAFVTGLEKYLIEHELEPQEIKVAASVTTAYQQEEFDLLILGTKNKVNIYSHQENYHTPLILEYVKTYDHEVNIEMICESEGTDYEG